MYRFSFDFQLDWEWFGLLRGVNCEQFHTHPHHQCSRLRHLPSCVSFFLYVCILVSLYISTHCIEMTFSPAGMTDCLLVPAAVAFMTSFSTTETVSSKFLCSTGSSTGPPFQGRWGLSDVSPTIRLPHLLQVPLRSWSPFPFLGRGQWPLLWVLSANSLACHC